MRKFEKLRDDVILPKRQTKYSAGYDFYAYEDVVIKSKSMEIIRTYVKCIMEDDEFLAIYLRSSLGIKHGLMLANQTGIIDKDYYGNKENDGHIMVAIFNNSDNDFVLKKNDRFCQGIFQKYYLVDDDEVTTTREGGIGSTKA